MFFLRAARAVGLIGTLAFATTASATIAYVQSAYDNPDSGNPISVTFTGAQTAGDLNVVVIGWNDSSSTVSSVTDTEGNTYVAAFSPTSDPGIATQVIYYAKNIVGATAGSNTVKVVFSGTVVYPDVRILEYSGLSTTNPVDVGVGASGTGVTQNSGSVTTTNANDLLVASNYVADSTTASGTGYTERLITNGGEIVEDETVAATGTYSAGSTQGGSSWWIMQLVAFRAATSGAAPTITSFTPTTGGRGTVITITGTNLSGATTPGWVGSAHDAAVANVNSTTVTMTVPSDAPAGADQLTVFTAGGTAVSASNFTVTTGDTQPPSNPTNLAATAGPQDTVLTWTASTDNVGVTGYFIERCTGVSCTSFAQIGTVSGTTTTYTDSTVVADTNYSYRVRATDAAGNLSGYSNVASDSPLFCD